ncbi:hypothetical protein PUMCH_004505 [Australozyma saopauloensis]|uniref:Uncharacterized protein n=1 Tax=Australozyma saopauloensis TaxID=291208 RepID=A0AAX4HGX1_9ASCO|nr:hypothetical protein PUMCH_004505 [[Candida] saopauloensis]
MNIAEEYRNKRYHKVILCWRYCKNPVEYLYLCLSLYGIGRRRPAFLLLVSRLQMATDINTKVMYLQTLYAITKMDAFCTEIRYLKFSPQWDDILDEQSPDLPDCLTLSPSDEVLRFKGEGAKIQTGSYAESCLLDLKSSQEIKVCTNFGPIILEAVARGGLLDLVLDLMKTPAAQSWAKKARSKIEVIVIPSEGDCFKHAAIIREIVHFATYHFLVGNDILTYIYCKHILMGIILFQDSAREPTYGKGLLEEETQNVAMMALEFASTDVSDDDLNMLLEALLYKSFGRIVHNEDSTNNCQRELHRSPLRGSKVFTSLGHAHRLLASKHALKIKFNINEKEEDVWILDRTELREAARCYIIAAFLDAPDNPDILIKYEQVVWCLLLMGGIDLAVIELFINLRNFHQKNLFFSYSGPNPRKIHDKLNMAWPGFVNRFEIINKIEDLFFELENDLSIRRLAPTVLEYDHKVYMATSYIPSAIAFTLENGRLEADLNEFEDWSRAAVAKNVELSLEFALMWYRGYLDTHEELPEEFSSYYEKYIEPSGSLWSRSQRLRTRDQ